MVINITVGCQHSPDDGVAYRLKISSLLTLQSATTFYTFETHSRILKPYPPSGIRSLRFGKLQEASARFPNKDRSSYAGAIQGIGMYGSLLASQYDIAFAFLGIPGGEGDVTG